MNTTKTINVSKTDSHAFHTIAEALSSIPKDSTTPVTISIGAGVYYEKLEINRPFVTLQGISPEQTILTYDDYARFLMPDGIKRGTFRSYTLFVNAPHTTLKNLTVQNTSGPSQKAGQAVALYADGDFFFCENCSLKSCQDTLFTAPLPEKEYEPGGRGLRPGNPPGTVIFVVILTLFWAVRPPTSSTATFIPSCVTRMMRYRAM